MTQKRAFCLSEFHPKDKIYGSPFYYNPLKVDGKDDGVVMGFITQGTTPILFLNWLKHEGLSEEATGRITLEYDDSYNDPEKTASFQTACQLAQDKRFNEGCTWISFEFPDFSVEWMRMRNEAGFTDLAEILVASDPVPTGDRSALQFLFNILNDRHFMPLIAPLNPFPESDFTELRK